MKSIKNNHEKYSEKCLIEITTTLYQLILYFTTLIIIIFVVLNFYTYHYKNPNYSQKNYNFINRRISPSII